MPKSLEKQSLHFARYLNLEIGISVQECLGGGANFLTLLLPFHFVLRRLPQSPELPIVSPNSILADCILPLLW